MSPHDDTVLVKATLLSGATVGIPAEERPGWLRQAIESTENHHGNSWIFLRLGPTSRVRLTVTENAPRFTIRRLTPTEGCVSVFETATGTPVAHDLTVEKALVHCPRQLFLGLYEHCGSGCLFCPLSYRSDAVAYTIDEMMADISRYEGEGLDAIGITTGVPSGMTSEDVGRSLAAVVREISSRTHHSIPIGVSSKHPSALVLRMLRDAGAVEARLNIEMFNRDLARRVMPNKHLDDILRSIDDACRMFGRGKVSSNMLVGLGETDDDLLSGIAELARLGAIATLYPFDPLPRRWQERLVTAAGRHVGIPSAERLVRLAVEHSRILRNHGLNAKTLVTMCPGCAASHIMPGRDLDTEYC